MQAGEVKLGGAADSLPRRIDSRAVLGTHGGAECGEETRAAVGTRAAPDADDDVAAAVIERLRNHRTEAMTGGRHRCRHSAGKPLQATDFRHFDNSGLPATAVRGLDYLACRPLGVDRDPLESRGEDGAERSVATVGDRALHRRQSGVAAFETHRYRVCRLSGRQ